MAAQERRARRTGAGGAERLNSALYSGSLRPAACPVRLAVREFPGGNLFGPLAHFRARLAGRGDGLVADRRQALARLAADDVAEGFLEALGAAVGGEARFGLGLLLRPPLAVAAPRPGRVRLADPAGAVDRDRDEEEADRRRAGSAP